MKRAPDVLTVCIFAAVATIIGLSVLWTAGCTVSHLRNGPYARTKTCENHEERAIATLVSLMATLISLKSNFPPPAP